MSLDARIAALATAIGQSLKRRGVPSGGAVGRVLGKTGPGDFETGWLDTIDPALLPDFYTRLAVQSRGMNLVTNGTGLMRSNYNFSDFEYYPQDTFAGAGSFLVSGPLRFQVTDELIPVNPNKYYRTELSAKSINYVDEANYAFAYSASRDIDGYQIQPENYTYDNPTFTVLTQPLKIGDSIIRVADASGWGGRLYNWIKIHRYINGNGYIWPSKTYSRNLHLTYNGPSARTLDVFADSGINTTANTIALVVPWGVWNAEAWDGTWPIGTPISTCFPAGVFQYFIAANIKIPNEWTPLSGVIGGIQQNGEAASIHFPFGTAFIQLGFLLNSGTGGLPDSQGRSGNTTAVSALSLSEITPENITGGLPGWTGTYLAQDGRTVTVRNGIITSLG